VKQILFAHVTPQGAKTVKNLGYTHPQDFICENPDWLLNHEIQYTYCKNFQVYGILLLYHFKSILWIKYNIWHLYCTKSILKHTHYYVVKIICSIDCSIRVYWSICNWCGEYIYSSMSTAPLIRICKILELEPHLLKNDQLSFFYSKDGVLKAA